MISRQIAKCPKGLKAFSVKQRNINEAKETVIAVRADVAIVCARYVFERVKQNATTAISDKTEKEHEICRQKFSKPPSIMKYRNHTNEQRSIYKRVNLKREKEIP